MAEAPTVTIMERRLRLEFAAGWQAVKFDDTEWYRQTMKARVKAVDVVAWSGASHWWIELKDCWGAEAANLPRLSPHDPPEVEQTRKHIKSQGLDAVVTVKRAKPFIVDEMAEKLEGTLLSIAAAQRAHATDLLPIAGVLEPNTRWSVVLLLTWNPAAPDYGRLAMRLRDKLRQRLAAYAPIDCFILNQGESAPHQPWTFTRVDP